MLKRFWLLALVAGLSFAADRSAEGVKAAEKSWASATLAGDEATLKQLLPLT